MKNYVIINGTNSNTLTGLMINELPPITKPEMRTQVEEIDGRDGDIITELGYSAYNKTITIGLFGSSYDVDNIIKFFNKEGTIIFSNEPDKYYFFKQIDNFDIERLLRFKTASITFHCQPFKYPTTETAKVITSSNVATTISNIGNIYSKPLIAIEGGNNTSIAIYKDNTQILQATVNGKMNIDIDKMEAYDPTNNNLLNRNVIGNYNSMTFAPGNNSIKLVGTFTKATITNYTRWL